MERKRSISEIYLSRRKVNKFKVQELGDPYLIKKYGENHEMEDVTLYACKNCLTETEYRGYDKRSSAQTKNKHVESFDIQE